MKTALNLSLLVVGLVAAVAFSHPRSTKPADKAADIWDRPIGEKAIAPAKWEYPVPIAEPATAPPVGTPDDEDDADESSSPPAAVAPKAKSKCTCGCAEGKPCTCGLKCPDIVTQPALQMAAKGEPVTRSALHGGWHTDYELAFAESQSTGKPLLLDVRQPSCPWCDRLDAELAQLDIPEFVKCKVDAVATNVSALGVTSTPTLIVIRNGQFGQRHVGYAPAQTIQGFLQLRGTGFAVTRDIFGDVVRRPAQILTAPVRVMGGACRSCGH